MDIFDKIAIEIPCAACGGRYEVSLKQVLLSQQMIHEGCPVRDERDCPPLAYASLVDPGTVRELREVWLRIEDRVRTAGGAVKLR